MDFYQEAFDEAGVAPRYRITRRVRESSVHAQGRSACRRTRTTCSRRPCETSCGFTRLRARRARSRSSATPPTTSTSGPTSWPARWRAAGATADDIVQVTYGYGLFTGGLGAHYGSERLGAVTIPISGGNTKRQVQVLKDFGTTILACTPSATRSASPRPRRRWASTSSRCRLRAGVFGAEPWSENMRLQIEETAGHHGHRHLRPLRGARAGRCGRVREQHGLHVNEDHFLIEIVDPETLRAGARRRVWARSSSPRSPKRAYRSSGIERATSRASSPASVPAGARSGAWSASPAAPTT